MNITSRIALSVSSMAMAIPAIAQNPGSCSPVLFDNGTFVTATTGGGPDGTDAISAIPVGGTFGSNSNTTFGFQLAEDFTVPAAGWNVGELTFYADRLALTRAAPSCRLDVVSAMPSPSLKSATRISKASRRPRYERV